MSLFCSSSRLIRRLRWPFKSFKSSLDKSEKVGGAFTCQPSVHIKFVSPGIRLPILQPKDAGGSIGGIVLDIGNENGFLLFVFENLHRVMRIPERATVQRLLDASVGLFLSSL